jgi:hypothetical protein
MEVTRLVVPSGGMKDQIVTGQSMKTLESVDFVNLPHRRAK